jgi:lysozyme
MPRVKPIYSNTFTKRRRVWTALIVICVLAVIGGLGAWLTLRNPRPNASKYPVLGVRVSQTDGTQDFDVLAKQDVRFVYLKATEGASYFDDNFNTNYSQASASGLAIGAYHFFSFTSSPAKQAAAFIDHVGSNTGNLPIGVEVSAYTTVPSSGKLTAQLRQFITLLRKHYGKQVLLIGTPTMLKRVASLTNAYPTMVLSSKQREGKQGTFWQYSTAAKIPGGDTEYHCIVYTGTSAAFNNLQ